MKDWVATIVPSDVVLAVTAYVPAAEPGTLNWQVNDPELTVMGAPAHATADPAKSTVTVCPLPVNPLPVAVTLELTDPLVADRLTD